MKLLDSFLENLINPLTSTLYFHFIFSAFKDSLLRERNVCESGRVPSEVVSGTMSQLGKANTTPLISLQFLSQTCKYTYGATMY